MNADLEFAIELDALAAIALADRDYAAADYLYDAADWHAEPSDETRSARILLLAAAMAAESARSRAGVPGADR